VVGQKDVHMDRNWDWCGFIRQKNWPQQSRLCV